MAELTAARSKSFRPVKLEGRSLFYTAMLLLVVLLVVYPLGLLLFNSFVVPQPGGGRAWSLANWVTAWSQRGMLQAVLNTFSVVLASQLIIFPIGVLATWLMVRTDMPGKGFLDFFMWVGFFLPTLPLLLGWIMLLDPQFGLANKFLVHLFGLEKGPFNIYSFWGIVFCHVVGRYVSATYIFLSPAFRNLDASLEEASRVAGIGPLGTLRRIVMPVMTPAILVTFIILLIHALETFEVERVLGPPINFFVFSTKIYQLINDTEPAFGAAMVLGVTILLVMAPLILFQQYLNARRSYTTITSHFRVNVTRLGAMRWPAFALVLSFCLFITVLPLIFLVMGTFMSLFGFFTIEKVWTLQHWHKLFADPILISSVWNTLKLAGGAALIGMVFFAMLAYISVRTKYAGRGLLDFLTWIPATIPGIILSLGMLWMFLSTPGFRPLYGTLAILVLALLINSMTTGVQLIKSNMVQLGNELEEASAVSGGSWLYTLRRVVAPILAPVLLSVATLTFISASRNVANIAMLVTNENRPLSILQLDYMVDGRSEVAAIVGVLVVLLTIGVALIVRVVGRRFGIRVKY